MSAATEDQIDELRPYLLGTEPAPDGEWDMHCPLHEDGTRSARLNVESGVWFCHASCGGGTVAGLIGQRDDWVSPPDDAGHAGSPARRMPRRELSEDDVSRWAADLRDDEGTLHALAADRNIGCETLLRYEIGYDHAGSCFTIPVRDADGVLVNVRRYQPRPTEHRRRGIWNTTGHGTPARLWPIDQLAANTIIVCEGEFDCLSLIDRGFAAITKTSGAKTWRGQWSPLFAGKTVYVCHDCDRPGQDANAKIARQIARYAAEVRTVRLPFEITDDHGQDVTDFFAANDAPAFQRLLDEAEPHAAGVRVDETMPDPERAERIAEEVERLAVREEARRIHAASEQRVFELPNVGRTLADVLAEPVEPQRFTIDRLHPHEGNAVLVAQYKAGKTTLALNLARSLADGVPFLDTYKIDFPTGRVAILNYEISERMFREWIADLGIKRPERIVAPLHLRGQILPFWRPDVRTAFARWLRENDVRFLIVDPAARASSGLMGNENDNAEMGAFVDALDRLKHEAGIPDLLLATHTGRGQHDEGQERARGATRLEDWMDVGWYLTKDDATGARSLRATGRDVEHPAMLLTWEGRTRRISWSGLTRDEARVEEDMYRVVEAVAEVGDGRGTKVVTDAMRGPRDRRSSALARAERRTYIRREAGPGTSKLVFLTEQGKALLESRSESG